MMAMQRGVIRRTGERGVGFITPTDEGPEVFFHIKAAGRSVYLEPGDKVLFALNPFVARHGRREAAEVRKIT
jgi:cold shock CspA family protein